MSYKTKQKGDRFVVVTGKMSNLNVDAFARYLIENDCEILDPTSQYELIRYKTKTDGVCILYCNAQGNVRRISKTVRRHIESFDKGKVLQKTRRPKTITKAEIEIRLRKRDGENCAVCGKALDLAPYNIEHFLSIGSGGNNNLDNLALTHTNCNMKLGDLPITKKIEKIIRIRKDEKYDPSRGSKIYRMEQ